jgi:hypothetical protein
MRMLAWVVGVVVVSLALMNSGCGQSGSSKPIDPSTEINKDAKEGKRPPVKQPAPPPPAPPPGK